METTTSAIEKICFVKMLNGEDVLSSLRAAVEKDGIQNAVILAGIGSATTYHYHVVGDDRIPPLNVFSRSAETAVRPTDIVSISGYVVGGRVHAHISFSDEKIQFGGHLEEGCRVLTFCLVTLGILADDPGEIDDFPGKRKKK